MLCLLFLRTDLCFLISEVIAQIFNRTAELVIPTGTTINEVTETKPVIADDKMRNCLI